MITQECKSNIPCSHNWSVSERLAGQHLLQRNLLLEIINGNVNENVIMQHWCRSQHNLRHCCLVWTLEERQALPGECKEPGWSPTSSCSPFLSISNTLSSSWRVDLQDAQVGDLSRTEGSNVLHRSRTSKLDGSSRRVVVQLNSSFSSSMSSSVGQHHCDLQNTLLAFFTGKYGENCHNISSYSCPSHDKWSKCI